MLKKYLFCLIIILGMIPNLVKASDNSAAKIGNNYYDNLKDAIAAAKSTDTITLTSNVVLEDSLIIDKVINLNLNGRNISGPSKVFQVDGGTLNLSGTGKIAETEPNYGAIFIKGSTDPLENEYSVVNVGKDIILEGWSGIFVANNGSKAYGVKVNLEGSINAVKDTSGGTGIGIYVNGNINHPDNHPIVNIKDGANIKADGIGLYIAGFATFNINKASITGTEAGIGIKSGILNINGANVTCTGKDETPTEGYNNGMNASGTTIQIESNPGYAGNIEINIKSGNFTSNHSNVIYEYIGKGTDTRVNTMNISGGNFISKDKKEVFNLSDAFKTKHPNFISGGTFSSNPTNYLKTSYTVSNDNDSFTVIKSTMKELFFNKKNNSTKKTSKTLIMLILTTILIIIAYFNRNKLFKRKV